MLIKFQSLVDYQQVADEDWNKDADGNYKLTPDEMYLRTEKELIDQINRVRKEPSEAADKGTAFNEIVDCLVDFRPCNRDDMSLVSIGATEGQPAIARAQINGFTFDYDLELCKDVAKDFKGALTQHYCEAEIQTARGSVTLYGYIDEWVGNRIYDIKTTKSYKWGKYEKGWQRHVYPWCVIESGEAVEIESFTYYVVEWAYQRKGEPLTAKNLIEETYTYDHEQSTGALRDMLESFIDWLESRREFIRDKKVFGGKNKEGWHGRPVSARRLEKEIFKEFKTI